MSDRTEKRHRLLNQFFVWGAIRESADWDYSDYFNSVETAGEAFEKQLERGHWKCLALGEIGSYTNKKGNEETDYIFFRWSNWNENSDVCQYPERGYGIPENSPDQAVRYTPLSVK